ncbi:uncharacterized protein LOC144245910 [Lonchura striata]
MREASLSCLRVIEDKLDATAVLWKQGLGSLTSRVVGDPEASTGARTDWPLSGVSRRASPRLHRLCDPAARGRKAPFAASSTSGCSSLKKIAYLAGCRHLVLVRLRVWEQTPNGTRSAALPLPLRGFFVLTAVFLCTRMAARTSFTQKKQQKMSHCAQLVAATLSILLWLHVADGWVVPQPKENVWITLAKSLQQDNLCLAMGNVDNPLSTCLVGVPLVADDWPVSNSDLLRTTGRRPNPVDTWDEWTKILPNSKEEPQELDLLGSSTARYCVKFYYRRPSQNWHGIDLAKNTYRKDVTPISKKYNSQTWCNYTSQVISVSSTHPKTLPRGMFLICGDRVWSGIPSRLQGGPCSLGKLATLTPNRTQILDWKKERQLARTKRSYAQFDENCDSEIYDWGKTKRVAVSIFLPWYAAAKALGELSHLECWISKHANASSAALSDLLADQQTTRQATLQNRAAIDFLLLAHGHSCEDFEGLCCFNLTSRSTSIQANIQRIRTEVQDIKTETSAVDPVHKLLMQWGIPGWAASILKGLFWIFIIILLISVALTIFKKTLTKTLANIYLINKNGGDVGGDLGNCPPELPWEVTGV